MIPPIIHYAWFGRKPLPTKIKTCISTWKKYLPEYEFRLWNEDTFDLENACTFVREAYENRQYAFVADYVRFYALYNYGGIYLDTDVELINSIPDSILNDNLVLVLDDGGYISGSTIMSTPKSLFIKDCMIHYESLPFVCGDGRFNNEVINTHMQAKLRPCGYKLLNQFQTVNYKGENGVLYPDDYFHVRSLVDGKMNLTPNSIAIHWHTILWASNKTKFINFVRVNILTKLLGSKLYSRITSRIKHGKTTI